MNVLQALNTNEDTNSNVPVYSTDTLDFQLNYRPDGLALWNQFVLEPMPKNLLAKTTVLTQDEIDNEKQKLRKEMNLKVSGDRWSMMNWNLFECITNLKFIHMILNSITDQGLLYWYSKEYQLLYVRLEEILKYK